MLELLLPPFAAALVILLIHAYFGLHVIQREVIFVDLALAQIAALGTTVAFLMGADHGTPVAYAYSLAFTLLGALIFSFTRLRRSPVPQEALIGITFVVASAAVILLASFTSEGTEFVKETLTGQLIWVTWPTVAKIAGVYAVIALFHFALRRTMLAITWAPDRIRSLRVWDFVFYATFGIMITASVPLAGVLLVFSMLVIPAVVAFFYTRTFVRALLLAWVTGAVAIMSGLAISFTWDLTTGPVLVVTFGAVLLLALLFRHRFGVVLEEGEHRGLHLKLLDGPAD